MYKSLFLLLPLLYGSACTTPAVETSEIPTADPPGLADLADFPIGGAINEGRVRGDSALLAIVSEEFSSLTATNDMKMYAIARGPGALDFTLPDAFVNFAERQGKRVFGHTLLWHYGFPRHLMELDGEAAEGFINSYIDTVVTRYRGRVDGWDVVNEAMATSGGELRETPWLEKIGKAYIPMAFRAADRADPEAKLFINDFNTERDTAKLNGLLALVEEMQADGVPIDGIGFQMHIRMDTDEELIGRSLAKAAATGLLIHLSEVDIIFNRHDDTQGGGEQIVDKITPELLEQQAQKYESLARLYRENVPPAQRYGITFWSFTDRDTWINGFFDLKDWPTLYDEQLQKKPAYYGFARGLRE
ncbi:endo-1,4-beta-xylanase [Neolewinella xylanilytica]|uniref:Beta-xylanase n=1 Tax=Neolewinella xylanilytica TaxID=1514080 RepID=A0A2S6I037_9BACT|nr:endo-1,4-beta-xylanase [Neolewinella xylanilytica]PPK84042.1 endo-1,4-beta-xylanase [Neolewinella xylanilytica]